MGTSAAGRRSTKARPRLHVPSRAGAALFGLVLLGVLASGAGAAAPEVTPLEKVRPYVQPSIVYLETTWTAKVYDTWPKNRDFVRPQAFTVGYRCTGFFVSPTGHIVTAGHCAQFDKQTHDDLMAEAVAWATAHNYYNRLTGNKQQRLQKTAKFATEDWSLRNTNETIDVAYGVQAAGIPQGRALPARVLGVKKGFGEHEAGDVALLKIEAEDTPALKLAPSQNIDVGESIVSVGYPASVDYVTDPTFDPSFKDGTISSQKTINNGLIKVYEIDAAVSGGMSGGPTVDLSGRVVGVNSFGIVGEPQAFNFIRPSDIVGELLADKGVTNQTSSLDQTYRQALNAYFAGDRDAAIKGFDRVLAVVPSHALAQQYRRKAELLPAADSGSSWWIIAVIAAGVLIALAVAGVLVRRRRRPAGPAAVASAPVPTTPAPGNGAPPALESGDTKICPECAETIKAAAKVCHYCGYRFDAPDREGVPSA